jgi:hypothetical protein
MNPGSNRSLDAFCSMRVCRDVKAIIGCSFDDRPDLLLGHLRAIAIRCKAQYAARCRDLDQIESLPVLLGDCSVVRELGALKHAASREFWKLLESLPPSVQDLARKNFDLLKTDPRHPSLHFKKIGRTHSVRIGLRHRALGVEPGMAFSGSGSEPTPTMTALCPSRSIGRSHSARNRPGSAGIGRTRNSRN